jgi:phosphoribosylaminoimidazole carboxylase
MSQYKAQILSILGLMRPTETIPMSCPAAIMVNILGGRSADSHNGIMKEAISMPEAQLHMYGKASKPGRKIGHITVVGTTMAEAERHIDRLITMANTMRTERKSPSTTSATPASTSLATPPQEGTQPLVAVTMGSDSDLPILKPGLKILSDLSIPFHVTITSAHRTPDLMTSFAKTASSRGIKVIIAAAGGAAHLPGMIAANSILPVVGVPVKASTLDGVDSLYSIVQMPRGVPVASMAINNSVNAALFAARILALGDEGVKERLERYVLSAEEEVLAKVEKLNEMGWKAYGEKS